MKRFLFIVAGMMMFVTSSGYAQKTYQTILSDPSKINEGYIGLTYFGIDAGFGNTTGASILSVGADVLYPINDKIKIDGIAWYSLFSLAKEGPAFLLNPGIEFTFSSKTKSQNVPVLLSFTTETDWFKGEQISAWSAVSLPGDMQIDYAARGGLYLRNSALEYVQGTTYYDVTNLFHAGVYAGIGRNQQFYLNVQDSDGNRFAAGRFLRTYADVLILPTTVDLELGGAPVTEVSETLGWRLGAALQLVPFSKENNYDRKIGFMGNMIWRLEFGQRPLDGFFVTTGLSWALKKF